MPRADDSAEVSLHQGEHTGSWSPALFSYVVQLRTNGADREALRKAVNNYSASLIGLLVLDEAKDAVAESLALAKELNDPVAERKAAISSPAPRACARTR